MDSTQAASFEKESMVDVFLVEALQDPRHRLTILRMELDIQKFLQSPDQQQFEFQHFPTSYLRLAAHRVAQHYGLTTMVQDNGIDRLANKILVKKTAESRYPLVSLSEIPANQLGSDKPEYVKIAIRLRPNKRSANESKELEIKTSSVRSVEKRKEEYDKARARIFNSPSSSNSDCTGPQGPKEWKYASLGKEENEGLFGTSTVDPEKCISNKDGTRIAIFRDREKDRTDPDYDRSYERYVRSLPTNRTFNVAPFNYMQKVHLPFVQYDTGFPQVGARVNYWPPASPVMSPFCSVGSNLTTDAATHTQWPSSTMSYAHSSEQFRHAVFQAPFCQQPLSFDYSQNH